MNTRFEDLNLGASFWFHAKRYVKTALSMAVDDKNVATIFQRETEVVEGDAPVV